MNESKPEYSAKREYRTIRNVKEYEDRRYYQGLLGRFRKKREIEIISKPLRKFFEKGSRVLDCPCGTGRWFNLLNQKADKIVGVDYSQGMVEAATAMKGSNIEVFQGDAERLNFMANEFDYVFSYALMKHLPTIVQERVLKEFSRVSRNGVLCSFAVFNLISVMRWNFYQQTESYPLWMHDIIKMAERVDLVYVNSWRLIPGLGLETLIYFRHKE